MDKEISRRPAESLNPEKSDPYTPQKLFGVGLLGAVAGIFLYYVYNELSDETKETLKETALSGVKAQLAQFAIEEPQHHQGPRHTA